MKKTTIDYVSTISYFSERKTAGKYSSVWQALSAHRRYVSRGGQDEHVVPLKTIPSERWKEWIDGRKRWDERVAMRFHVALPNDLSGEALKQYAEGLLKKMADHLGVPMDHVEAYVHTHPGIASPNNHMHVVIYPKTHEGKSVRLSPSEVRKFRNVVREYASQHGYAIRYRTEGEKIGKIGFPLRKFPELREAYRSFMKLAEELDKSPVMRAVNSVSPLIALPAEPVGGKLKMDIGEFFIKKSEKGYYLYRRHRGRLEVYSLLDMVARYEGSYERAFERLWRHIPPETRRELGAEEEKKKVLEGLKKLRLDLDLDLGTSEDLSLG